MFRRITLIVFLASLVLLVACSGDAVDEYAPDTASYSVSQAEEPAAFDSNEANIAGEILQTSLQAQDNQEQLIIREGTMYVIVEDTDISLVEFARLAENKGGWVVSSELYGGGRAKSGSISIRIPVDQFDNTMSTIRQAVVEVDSESTSSQDVTEDYVDLEARVGNLEVTADRVRSFLDEAKTVDEALDVNRELSRLEGEIESLKARMKYLSQSAAFSLLVIYLTPDELSQPIEIAGWRPEGVARDAFESLLSALESLGSAAIWIGIFCVPLSLLFGLPLFLIGRAVYRRRVAGKEEQATSDLPAGEAPDMSEADSKEDHEASEV